MKPVPQFGCLAGEPDSRDYLMSAVTPSLERRPTKLWTAQKWLDQNGHPYCVAYSWAHFSIAAPTETLFWTTARANTLYAECKRIDKEPGKENGTTIRSGAKAMKKRGHLGTYYFAGSVEEAADYVAHYGPVVMGSDFTQGMCYPTMVTNTMRATGPVLGRHAYLLLGVEGIWGTILNSWLNWGRNGRARMKLSELEKVFASQGEACAATEKVITL